MLQDSSPYLVSYKLDSKHPLYLTNKVIDQDANVTVFFINNSWTTKSNITILVSSIRNSIYKLNNTY